MDARTFGILKLMLNQKGFTPVLLLLTGVFILTLIGGLIYKFNRNNDNRINQAISQLSPTVKPNNIQMPPLQTVPVDRLNSLEKGVSISSWFGYPDEETDLINESGNFWNCCVLRNSFNRAFAPE